MDFNVLKERSEFLKRTRSFFYERSYLEVDTPHLVPFPSSEPYIDSYEVQTENGPAYLISSPECEMKKILALGARKIFEIAHAYRSYEQGEWHRREFLMLEWYHVGQELNGLMDECKNLLNILLGDQLPIKKIAMSELFHEYYGCDLERLSLEKVHRKHSGFGKADEMSYDDLFFRLFLPLEKFLTSMGIVFLYDYPKELSAYAKVENGHAKRFEVYIKGIEIGNAYLEETRPDVLMKKMKYENTMREKMGKKSDCLNLEFIHALEHISEPISGIAMGLDRIFAIFLGEKDLGNSSPY